MLSCCSSKQHTLKSSVFLEGVGLQTNQKTSVHIDPADPHTGIVFVREDLPEKPVIKANCDYVISTLRCTTIGVNATVSISTIEHLMAALVGCRVDNAVIRVQGPEIPILDGSSQPFVDAIMKGGVLEQDAEKQWYEVSEPLRIVDETSNSEMVILPSQRYQITTMVDFGKGGVSFQSAKLEEVSSFNQEFACCRTFCFYSEIEDLLAKGLIKGGDIHNAIVVIDKEVKEEEKKKISNAFHTRAGITTQVPLRYDNELARHKLLDTLGDLALVGVAFKGHVICTKPGHKINVAAAKKIRATLLPGKDSLPTTPFLKKEAIIDIQKIKQYLPHRYPFLLVDKVVEIGEKHIVAIKNTTFNELFFQGHFPAEPVMPGVLVVEAMAQAGGILVLHNKEQEGTDITNVGTYFLKIDSCRFRNKIIPGDSLVIRMDMLYQNARGIIEMEGRCFVNDRLCCDALLTAQVLVGNPLKK